jgi:hypothetical protein
MVRLLRIVYRRPLRRKVGLGLGCQGRIGESTRVVLCLRGSHAASVGRLVSL